MQTEAIIDYITGWMGDYLKKSKQNGFVVGVSGGIDSAVTSTLAARTGAAVLVLEMPIHQHSDQVNRAQEHIAWLQENFENVTASRVDLTPTFDAFTDGVGVDYTDPEWELSLANSRARLRMTTLYYFAGLHRYLVAGTGNKVEDFGVGFFTKYGDGGVDLSPIADLMKSEVYQLAEKLGIIESIQQAAPTDGLWKDNRTDEEQMGASYDELEWAMSVYDDKKAEDFEGRKKEVYEIYDRLHRAMQHKVNPIPVAVIPEHLKK